MHHVILASKTTFSFQFLFGTHAFYLPRGKQVLVKLSVWHLI